MNLRLTIDFDLDLYARKTHLNQQFGLALGSESNLGM